MKVRRDRVEHRDLDAADEGDPKALRGRGRLSDPVDGVVVGQGEELDPGMPARQKPCPPVTARRRSRSSGPVARRRERRDSPVPSIQANQWRGIREQVLAQWETRAGFAVGPQ